MSGSERHLGGTGDEADFGRIGEILLTNSWFQEIPEYLREAVIRSSRLKTYENGTYIHFQGDESDGICAVLDGAVKVSSLSPEGNECVFRYLAPGSWFGEIGVLDKGGRTHDALAIGDTEVLTVPTRNLEAILDAHPVLYKYFSSLLCRVIRTAFTMLNDSNHLSVSARLAKRLLSFADAYGQPHENGVMISLHLTQNDLAVLLNTTRQTINKRLVDWQDRGWIQARYGKIVIMNTQVLQQLLDDELGTMPKIGRDAHRRPRIRVRL